MKNLKTKDYLGKARLVAAADPWNVFATGFTGSENKMPIDLQGRDDRPPGNISFAASNLVKPDLTSQKARERSAPPAMDRNKNNFPPTPPPEPLPAPSFGANGMTGRAASVRNPANRRQPLSLQRTNTIGSSMSDPPSFNGIERGPPSIFQDHVVVSPPRRRGTVRTNSEPPVTVRRAPSRTPLYGEREELNVYDMYTDQTPKDQTRVARRGTSKEFGRSRQPAYIEEEDEDEEGYVSDAYEGEDFMHDVGVDFEMVGGAGALSTRHTRGPSGHQRTSSRRIVEVKKIRVKVHLGNDETRYLMIGPAVTYDDFEAKVREKFGLRKKLRMRMQDDGDMITMADQDDLDMLVESAKSAARKEKQDMGKMDVSSTTPRTSISTGLMFNGRSG